MQNSHFLTYVPHSSLLPPHSLLLPPQHLRLFLDNSDLGDIVQFFDSYYSHIYFIVYDSFVNAEQNLRAKGAHKAQREELEAVLYLLEKILIFLPEALSQRWQYHSIGN